MITLDIVDNTLIKSGSVYITGHGIPGTTPPGSAPQTLNVLGAQGSFVQGAVVISTAACTGTTVTITTVVPHEITVNQTVFVSGVSVAASALGAASGGAVYLSGLISSQTISSASGVGNIVTVTLNGTSNIPVNSPIFLSGLTGVGAGWNGVWTVSQNPLSNPALTAQQFQVFINGASGTATLAPNPTVQSVALTPIRLTALPQQPTTTNPYVSLNQAIEGCSAQLVVMVTPDDEVPFPLGLTPGTANLSNLVTPPFAVGDQTGNAVADIVEFYYAGSGGGSTFDVSQVDGIALPLTLASASVTSGPTQVGVNTALQGLDRQRIGEAFTAFIGNEPTDVQTSGQFGRLLYNGPVNANALAIAPAAQAGTALQNVQLAALYKDGALVIATAATPHGLVPGQTIAVTCSDATYAGTFTVDSTGLTNPSLTSTQFTYSASSSPSSSSTGTVTPTNSGVIATSTVNLAVEITSGTAPSQGATVQLSGVTNDTFDGAYTVLPIPANAGLSASAVFLASTTNQNFTVGSASGGGTLGTPVFVAPPPVPGGQFYVIAAPKDWLANQPVATANSDALATWWDTTINAFFATGNYLQVATGTTTSYTGVFNAATLAFDFYAGLATTGTASFSITKPAPSGGQSQSLANATWVWAQAGIPSNDQGTVWDQIVQAFCRGVVMDGVLTSAPSSKQEGFSNKAWTHTANWYTEHSSSTFPNFTARYCPFSKFLHYGTLAGGTDRTGAKAIYTENLAYGFSEDEIPLGANGSAIATLVPSKMDGTVPDGAAMTLTISRFLIAPAQGMAVMEAGVVIEVVVTNPGSGYLSPPTVTITPPNTGMPATAVATVVDGQVTAVTMTNQGSGYDFGPQVTFSHGQ